MKFDFYGRATVSRQLAPNRGGQDASRASQGNAQCARHAEVGTSPTGAPLSSCRTPALFSNKQSREYRPGIAPSPRNLHCELYRLALVSVPSPTVLISQAQITLRFDADGARVVCQRLQRSRQLVSIIPIWHDKVCSCSLGRRHPHSHGEHHCAWAAGKSFAGPHARLIAIVASSWAVQDRGNGARGNGAMLHDNCLDSSI